jgi:TRAP-type C4-dicarboxylate transport system substrate-binding protein
LDSFTPEDVEFVRQAAVDGGADGVEVARTGLTIDEGCLIDKISGFGVEIISLTVEERQAFVDATRPVYDAWKERIGAPLVEQAEQSIANR